jgi:hypothetical protein
VPTSKGDGIGIDTASLKAALGRQAPAQAAAGGGLLLQTFQDLLLSLIGESLTERLLLPAWTGMTRSPSAQDARR